MKKNMCEPRKDGAIKLHEMREVKRKADAALRNAKRKCCMKSMQMVYIPEEKMWVFAKKGKPMRRIVEQIEKRKYINLKKE